MKQNMFSYLMLVLIVNLGWATIGYSQNQPPALDPIADTTISEGEELEFRVFATDPDLDSIILSVDGNPGNSTFVDSGNGAGSFYFEPNHLQSGIYNVTFIASDTILADSESVTITVDNEPWAWVWINDTTAYTGKQDSKITVMMQSEIPIGGIDLKFIVNRNDVFNFSTDHIDTSIEGSDTVVARVMDLDTVGTCINDFDWLYPYGDLGDTLSPECRWMTVAGQSLDEAPIQPSTCVLFRLLIDMYCFSDTNTNRIAYVDIVGSLSDSIGFVSIPILTYGTITIMPSECGDVNGDEYKLIDDIIYVANYYFGKGPPPCPLEAGDIDLDGNITIGDAIAIANHIFKGKDMGCYLEK